MKNRKKRDVQADAGFTLMELMTVIAIIAILSTIAIPGFIQWRQSSKLSSATRNLTTDLSLARMHAIKSYHPGSAGVKVIFGTSGYTIFIDDNNDNTVDAGEEVLKDIDYPAGVSMSGSTFTGNRTVFTRTGTVSPAGTVSLNQGGGTLVRVVVSTVGRIRVETV